MQRNPFVSAIVVAVVAVGIATSVIAITLYHAKAGNPIWWKNDVLYRVMLDSRPAPREAETSSRSKLPPFSLIYADAQALYGSNIPARSAMMLATVGPVSAGTPGTRPLNRSARLTTREFFPMFDVPFLYGQAWTKQDDDDQAQVAVISRSLSERVFGTGDTVGRHVVFSGQAFKIIGVIDRWQPLPRFYDGRGFGPSDDVFLPFRWSESLPGLQFVGFCERKQTAVTAFKELATSECNFVNFWVELANQRQIESYRAFLDNYSRDQLKLGRYERPLNNRLANVSTWLEMNDVVGGQSKLHVILALIFLGICMLNTLGLLLAKFMAAAPLTGLRRALGATRADIMRQHFIEVLVLCGMGGVLGTSFAALGLRLIRRFFFWQANMPGDQPEYAQVAVSLSHLDPEMILAAVMLSLLAGVLAGVYPAWRIGRMAPATFLKIQ